MLACFVEGKKIGNLLNNKNISISERSEKIRGSSEHLVLVRLEIFVFTLKNAI